MATDGGMNGHGRYPDGEDSRDPIDHTNMPENAGFGQPFDNSNEAIKKLGEKQQTLGAQLLLGNLSRAEQAAYVKYYMAGIRYAIPEVLLQADLLIAGSPGRDGKARQEIIGVSRASPGYFQYAASESRQLGFLRRILSRVGVGQRPPEGV